MYLWEMKIQMSRSKMRMNTQTDPLKIQGTRMKHYSDFECGMIRGSRASLSRNHFSLYSALVSGEKMTFSAPLYRAKMGNALPETPKGHNSSQSLPCGATLSPSLHRQENLSSGEMKAPTRRPMAYLHISNPRTGTRLLHSPKKGLKFLKPSPITDRSTPGPNGGRGSLSAALRPVAVLLASVRG